MELKQKFQNITILNQFYTRWKWRERKVSFGGMYPDKVFFVIRRAYCKVGLFSYVMTNMGMVDYALKKGYIPVIDMQNGRNTYLDDDKVGKENSWEYFFKQPCGYSLEDIKKAKNVILSGGLITEKNSYPDFSIMENEDLFAYWYQVFQRYFKLTDEIVEEFQEFRKELLGEGRILGILARGTDYVSAKPKGHPIQPTAEQIIEKTKEIMESYFCDKIFLATEDASIYKKMKEAFGRSLIAPDTERYITSGGQNINDLEVKNDKYQKGKEYLLSIMTLASCDCLVAGNVGGTHGAMLLSRGFDYSYIFDLGKYE